jgi:hypothetical protein
VRRRNREEPQDELDSANAHVCDVPIRTVRVGSGICHRENALAFVLEGKVFVCELVAIDALTARTIVIGKVPTLAHELWNHAMEGRTLVAVPLFHGAQCAKVLRCRSDHERYKVVAVAV